MRKLAGCIYRFHEVSSVFCLKLRIVSFFKVLTLKSKAKLFDSIGSEKSRVLELLFI